ncbi:MAG: cytochrome c-type biogenesis protein [Idiomarina sp.]
MRVIMAVVLVVTLMLLSSAAVAEQREFETAAQQQVYYELINELRCPKCQNQTIADSDAPLAKDLRDRSYDMVMAGQSKQQVIDFMVARYGDFVHYQPPMQWSTSILWFAPILVIGFGILAITFMVKSQKQQQVTLSEQEQARLQQLQQGATDDS